MESSEDDAGAAKNASRRASARERDVGGGKDGGTSDSMPQEPAEAGTASESASMSEETFDADSVPSPSAQDVNTSTEAILDMIDEIVDGPDAVRRRSHTSPDTDDGVCTASSDAATEAQPPCDLSTQITSSVTQASDFNAETETVSQDSASDLNSENVTRNAAPTTSNIIGVEVSPESVNKTQEDCTTATPTGVVLPAEVLQETDLMQKVTTESNTLPDEVNTRPQENLQIEQQPCQEAKLPDNSAETVPNEPSIVSEPCPKVSTASDCLESVPEKSDKQATSTSLSVQPDNINTIRTSSEIPIETLSQCISEPISNTASPQATSSVASNEAAESTSSESALHAKPDEPSNLSPSIPSSSIVEVVENVSDSCENQISERTIKCVTSSDNRDNVTVESAESTSSESSSSARDERPVVSELATRSPLRRRLVRPAPSDRRPDSTVSSSGDSQNIHVDTTEQTTSESVTKDVSSSSDAVTSVYCNIKPEEIRVSEISVCKAETSMSPPKKIKLVRQKITPLVAQTDSTSKKHVSHESEQCQSTSSDCTPTPLDFASSSSSISRSALPEDAMSNVSNDYVTHDCVAHLPEKSNEISDMKALECVVELKDGNSSSQPPISTEKEETSKDSQEKKVPPIKLNLSTTTESTSSDFKLEQQEKSSAIDTNMQNVPESTKQVPKLTIKLSSKQSEEIKSPIPKLTIKPVRPPPENDNPKRDMNEQIPNITKLNIKPIPKPAEKVNDIHRKSSSSEISESESSENDESNSMSDPASNSDQRNEVVPKVTIKVGKPGTESEGKFYTEQNAPKLVIKGLQSNENEEHETSKLKLVISQPEEIQPDKIPKLTIKTISKSEGQPLSPKLTIKPIKPPENTRIDSSTSVESAENPPIPKMKISAESISSNADVKENAHIPKITIKPVVKSDAECGSKTPKKSAVLCNSPEHIPVVTKLNIKPVLKPIDCEKIDNLEERVPIVSKLHIKPVIKPADSGETSEESEGQIPVVSKLNIKPILKPMEANESTEPSDVPIVSKLNIKPILKPVESGNNSECIEDKVPVVSKLNIKPILKPKDNEVESSIEDLPKVTKLNIKPLKNPEEKSSEEKDCDVKNDDTEENSIPVVTKINIKPIVKPLEEDTLKDSENQSSETGNSSDDNTDHIPIVTKINIKPIIKPNVPEQDATISNVLKEESIPVVTKLNIKPVLKPEESKSPSSPKRDVKITKLNIKPVVKPEEIDEQKKNENEEVSVKNPPLLMKINIKNVADATPNENISDNKKVNNIDDHSTHMVNNVEENIPKVTKINIKPIPEPDTEKTKGILVNCKQSSSQVLSNEISRTNCVPDIHEGEKIDKHSEKSKCTKKDVVEPIELQKLIQSTSVNATNVLCTNEISKTNENIPFDKSSTKILVQQPPSKPQSTLQNCTLLKKLLETKKDGLDKRLDESRINVNHTQSPKPEIITPIEVLSSKQHSAAKVNSDLHGKEEDKDFSKNKINDVCVSEIGPIKHFSVEDTCKEPTENLTRPLEISISDKLANQSSGQDSPRIILKINKTDHGPSAKIITEERPSTPQQVVTENTQDMVNDKQSQKRVINSRKKPLPDTPNVHMGKRLRSSRIVEEKSPIVKKNASKRPSSTETSPVQNKEPELSVLESKRLKLGQLLSNKSLTITPVPTKSASVSPTKPNLDTKQSTGKTVNHSLLNNENCSKNGNSKLHNILSNLQAKQAQALAFNEIKKIEKVSITPELESNASTGSSDVVEVIVPIENSHPDVMIINDNSESRDLLGPPEEVSQDPLEVEAPKPSEPACPSPVPLTPQPKKRGRPRKLPLSEPAKPAPIALPVPALVERPQRSLRLSRDRPTPTILVKPRGRGRGRGARRAEPEPREEPIVETANKFYIDEKPTEDIDPTSSRIKLPRMTEALDKLPTCTTPLSSRRRSSSTSTSDMKMFEPEPKVVLDILPKLEEALGKSPLPSPPPETPSGRGGRGGRGKRGGRGHGVVRTPRSGRGRGRGGGRGAQYMKETMGIYGRVCGPATTTVQLFEEETCMMDDNATPAKSVHFDEDSQSSVMSSTNDSSRMKKSKFADLFDSNKVWTAADVKEYMWPPPETPDVEHQVMMIQEQVAMFLGVKSFKRRYPELKRRSVAAEERDYVLHKGLVTEALCDLGITAVDASEVLDIMLSDYPHKYEEYRQHQRQKQIAEAAAVEEPTQDSKPEQKMDRIEMKVEAKPVESKPEPPKVDIEKTRQEAMAAAIASASEFNARMNALRRGACVDLQTHTVHRRRPPVTRLPPAPATPPAGLYPHALLPGQYQHYYRTYTPEQLRYFPLSTVTAAPPPPPSPPPSESSSEPDWGSSSSADDSDSNRPTQPKRKKLSKRKRVSGAEAGAGAGASGKEEAREEAELCRVCKLRLEANRKYTHERFLVCANCNAKLHPGCVDLSADTVRKAREYAWQCAECKACCACRTPRDHDKMLFCDLCDRGFHIYCVGLASVPQGRWHCVECAICKSCGAREPSGPAGGAGAAGAAGAAGEEATWHHHTKRGPGGHKVYSHSLCTPCARAYRIGRYCPLCDRSFIGPKGTMQLVICKLCDRQHHQECVKQTVAQLNVLDYTCAECRRGGITSRSAAARLAPRTIATLFMAKRRFNKYAHRQYMASRLAERASEPAEPPLASDVSDSGGDAADASDPLEGAGAPDEAAAAVAALQMDFGD